MLASELLLGLAVQRGSLKYLLEWIEMALKSDSCISCDELSSSLMQMKQATISSDQSNCRHRRGDLKSGNVLPLHQAAIILMEEVSYLFFIFSMLSLFIIFFLCNSIIVLRIIC